MCLTGSALRVSGNALGEYGKPMHKCGNSQLGARSGQLDSIEKALVLPLAPRAERRTSARSGVTQLAISSSADGARIKVSRGSSPNTRR